jgi:sugar-specific transcriptional regulator TrmB
LRRNKVSVVDEARGLIERAIRELDHERNRLEKALRELGKDGTRKRPGRPKGSGKAAAPKRRRRKGSNRADQAAKIIQKEPGLTASEIAKKMRIKPNYLYRVLAGLEKEQRVKKTGRKYFQA